MQLYDSCGKIGVEKYRSRVVPGRGLLAVDELIFLGPTQVPVVLDLFGVSDESLDWRLKERDTRSGLFFLGLTFLLWGRSPMYEWGRRN